MFDIVLACNLVIAFHILNGIAFSALCVAYIKLTDYQHPKYTREQVLRAIRIGGLIMGPLSWGLMAITFGIAGIAAIGRAAK